MSLLNVAERWVSEIGQKPPLNSRLVTAKCINHLLVKREECEIERLCFSQRSLVSAHGRKKIELLFYSFELIHYYFRSRENFKYAIMRNASFTRIQAFLSVTNCPIFLAQGNQDLQIDLKYCTFKLN